MASADVDTAQVAGSANPATTQLRISSGNGPVSRTVLKTAPRDALPSEIPIIDVSGIFSLSEEARAEVARQIRDAATNNGFFYIKNHGIPAEVPEAACERLLEFFRQPQEVKERAHIGQSRYFNGYKPPRSQRINPFESVDVRETFSWTYDPRYDPSVPDPAAIPPHIARYLRYEDFYWEATANLPHFKAAIVRYWRACLAVARALVRSFALSLDLPEDFFADKFTHPDAALALNYYPPLPTPSPPGTGTGTGTGAEEWSEQGEAEVSIGSHTDFQLFTILWQDDSGGLQVLNRQGQWIHARPVPGTFVVNIADYMQRITNDRYVSTVHRALNHSGRERISMPFFFGFNLNESCGVLDGCVAEGEPRRYGEISCEEWVQRRARAMHREGEEEEKEEESPLPDR
ncbi:putative 2og-fe oxygenase superfamily protein [Rosellinia necatrix]|uniref:Putative 2og-fe oxygenase superfamily protein n=1 Tax=Rosellinia necatrix TaxID=77044 RepID=A0A1W2TH01_ROSNE|nr:putative 2og-fe oxygenase superfamily protein [Rosellinia necatrix]